MVSWEPPSKSPSGKPSHFCSNTRWEIAAWPQGLPMLRSSLLLQRKATTMMQLIESVNKIWGKKRVHFLHLTRSLVRCVKVLHTESHPLISKEQTVWQTHLCQWMKQINKCDVGKQADGNFGRIHYQFFCQGRTVLAHTITKHESQTTEENQKTDDERGKFCP